MQSSYKILKSTIVENSAIVAPPIIEKLFASINSKNEAESGTPSISFEDVCKSIEAQARTEAVKIIEEAKFHADEIIKKANEESNFLFQKSREEGYQSGYGEGYKAGYDYGLNESKDEGNAIKKEAEDFLVSCQIQSREYIRDCQREIVDLSMNIAKQILNAELTMNPDAIFKIAEKVVSAAVEKKQILLRVNPQDFSIVKNRKDELSIYVEDSNNIIVVADPSLSQGSIKAETPSGFIDGSIESQLNMILNKLLEV